MNESNTKEEIIAELSKWIELEEDSMYEDKKDLLECLWGLKINYNQLQVECLKKIIVENKSFKRIYEIKMCTIIKNTLRPCCIATPEQVQEEVERKESAFEQEVRDILKDHTGFDIKQSFKLTNARGCILPPPYKIKNLDEQLLNITNIEKEEDEYRAEEQRREHFSSIIMDQMGKTSIGSCGMYRVNRVVPEQTSNTNKVVLKIVLLVLIIIVLMNYFILAA